MCFNRPWPPKLILCWCLCFSYISPRQWGDWLFLFCLYCLSWVIRDGRNSPRFPANKQASATKWKTSLGNYFRSIAPLAYDVTLYVGFIYWPAVSNQRGTLTSVHWPNCKDHTETLIKVQLYNRYWSYISLSSHCILLIALLKECRLTEVFSVPVWVIWKTNKPSNV